MKIGENTLLQNTPNHLHYTSVPILFSLFTYMNMNYFLHTFVNRRGEK